MPGTPAIYYGSEYGIEGDKKNGDDALRQPFELMEDTALTKHIAKLSKFRTESDALNLGSYRQLHLQNHNYAFAREYNGETVVAMINAGEEFTFNLNMNGDFEDILTGEKFNLSGGVTVPACSSRVFKKL